MRGTSRSRGASSTTFSTAELARGEQPVALTMCDERLRLGGRARTALRPTRAETSSAVRRGRGRARASAAARRSACSAPAAGRRCRSAPARAAAAARRRAALRPSSASSRRTPASRSTTARTRSVSRTPSRLGLAARPDARPSARVPGSGSCCHATSWPAGAQSAARRRKKRNVTKRSPAGRRGSRATRRAPRPAGTRSAGRRPRFRRSPSTRQLPLAAVAVERREVVAIVDAEASAAARLDAAPAARGTSARAARDAASGRARRCPSAQKFASFGTSPKSPPYAQYVAAARVRLPDPVVDPLPDEPALERVVVLGTRRSSRRARRSSCPSRASTRRGSSAAGRRSASPPTSRSRRARGTSGRRRRSRDARRSSPA